MSNRVLCMVACWLAAFTLIGHAATGKIVTFDPPGVGTAVGGGTFALAMNDNTMITGFFTTDTGEDRGFLVNGTTGQITVFDAPGQGATLYTVPLAINNANSIVGCFDDAQGIRHGFLRDSAGNFTTIDPPGAYQTFPTAINDVGTVVGYYNVIAYPYGPYAFIRDAAGNFTIFSTIGLLNQVYPTSINASGRVAGYAYSVLGGASKGFFTDATGRQFGYSLGFHVATGSAHVNDLNFIAGASCVYRAGVYDPCRGFIRYPAGVVIMFDAPNSANGTFVGGINRAGTTTGYGLDVNQGFNAWIRDQAGIFTTFSVPDAGTGAYMGTLPYAINRQGQVAGYYGDANKIYHGFLRK